MKTTAALLLTGFFMVTLPATLQAATLTSCIACNGGSIDFYLGTPLFDNSPGGLPSGTDEKKIYLDSATNVTSFTGNVDSQAGLPETLGSTDVPVDAANGFANIKPINKGANIGSVNFSVPGFVFGDFLFDVQLDNFGTGSDKTVYPLSISAYGLSSTLLGSWNFAAGSSDLKANADLSFLVLSGLSNIDHVVISSLLSGVGGMLEVKHFKVSELHKVGELPPEIPLPPAAMLFMTALTALGFASRRRRIAQKI